MLKMIKSKSLLDFSNGPLCCPLTRSSLKLLDSDEEVFAINSELQNGELTLAAGKIPGGEIDGVLISTDGQYKYPIIGGVPCLFDDFRIIKQSESGSTKEVSLQMNDLQRDQWEAFSARYERWTGGPDGIITKVQEEFQRRNFDVLLNGMKGAVILDVGNGGATVIEQLGPEVASAIKTFYALDSSYPMLTRNNNNGDQILGDAKKLPFLDKSVDFVLVNNPLHHFGRHKGEDPSKMMKDFFNEAFRVSRNGVIGVEMVIPHLALHVETFVLKYLKFMPTFVYSERFYSRLIADLGVEIVDFETIPQRHLISPFKFGPPIMDLPSIQLPALLTPYSFLFYRLSPKIS
jgi:ubiquinone/menaquinone biosynthesis C-methylase UbiE/uncharacterized protein YbaR (Trm112 family)